MPTTVAKLIQRALLALNEVSNTPIGNLDTGTGGAADLGLTESCLGYINECASDMARGCWPIMAVGTFASLPIGTQSFTFNNGQVDTGGAGELWAVRHVVWGGNPLTETTVGELDMSSPAWFAAELGSPTTYYMAGLEAIGLHRRPSAVRDLVIHGLVVPAPVTDAEDVVGWLPDSLTQLIVWYLAAAIALKNLQNASMRDRALTWNASYAAGKTEQLARLWQNPALRDIAEAFYPAPAEG
jgi:hypothetical protein